MNEYKDEVEILLEYYLELPFNLSLPTGDYPLNIPRQIRIRRDMYFLQKGNEIMNLSTLQRRIEPQDRLFDDRGLVDDKFSDFTFIRKMKTVIFAHYKIPLKLRITIEVFENMLRKGEITEKNLLIKNEMLLGFHKRFKREINEFLSFYSSFFPTNDIKNLIQHEVRPLSSYEFSKCESGIIFNYNNLGVQFAPIIEDSGNLLGIPDSTYPYELNKDKFAQFEQLMINRKMYQLLSYQKMFHLARSLYRTNKNDMTSIIIINALTSLETLFNILENIESDFEKFKKLRKKEKINGKKKKVQVLNFYLNTHRRYKDEKRPEVVIREVLMKLSNLISFYNPSLTERHQALKTVSYLNYGRLIRNEIIHQGEVKYDLVKEEFQFRFKPYSCNLKITFEELWKEICNAYNSLNLHLLKIKFPDLSWDIDTKKKMTHIATSVAPSKEGMVLIVANYDWRETFSYNHNLAQFTVPPEKFPVGIKTKDGKLVNLNIDHERGKYELIDQRFDKNEQLEVKFITFTVDISYEEFKKLQEEKNLAVFLGSNYYFHSCPNCDFIIPVHRHIEYQNDFCPKCKNKFNLREFEKKIFLNLYEKAKEENNFNKALIYIQKSIDIAPDDKALWDNKSFVLINMKLYDLAIECCNHIIGKDKEFGNAYYNKSCAYALKKDLNNAISNLKIAIGLKKEYKTLAKKDKDFEFIKESTEFEEIIK